MFVSQLLFMLYLNWCLRHILQFNYNYCCLFQVFFISRKLVVILLKNASSYWEIVLLTADDANCSIWNIFFLFRILREKKMLILFNNSIMASYFNLVFLLNISLIVRKEYKVKLDKMCWHFVTIFFDKANITKKRATNIQHLFE